jgi:hypothetical protein
MAPETKSRFYALTKGSKCVCVSFARRRSRLDTFGVVLDSVVCMGANSQGRVCRAPQGSSKPILCPRSQRDTHSLPCLANFSHVRILVNSSRMGCSVSLSILLASEGISVVASSAVSGVRVPSTVSLSQIYLHCIRQYLAAPSRPWSAPGACRRGRRWSAGSPPACSAKSCRGSRGSG